MSDSPTSYSIGEIAQATGLDAAGDLSLRIARPSDPETAGGDDLALAMSPAYEAALRASGARAAVLWPQADWRGMGLAAALFAPRARVALAALGELYAPPLDLAPGIHPSAVIDPSARIGADAWIGPLAVIGPGASIGPSARIMAHVSIGGGARIGAGALLHPGVRIGADVRAGARLVVQPNAVIGADGFSFVTPAPGAAESARATGKVTEASRITALRRINSLGSVEIGDDVEIGAGTTIDRGTVAATRIGNGTKIDNLVQIGHNVRIGEICLICGQTGIAGSARIGDRVVLGGKSGIADHVEIGADSVIAAGGLVASDVAPRSVMIGAPALPRGRFTEQAVALRRLPGLAAQIREIRKALGL
jgi:UDP-3-O-[3-hydroxymyristoyl] glucosamine N-acyltransferase